MIHRRKASKLLCQVIHFQFHLHSPPKYHYTDDAGYDYPVTAALEKVWFPTKEYDGFALPAGEYTALRIIIGEGAGQNWWCVAFPPLCLGAASDTVEDAAAAGYFSQDQAALITEEDQGYVLKFKSMELLGQLQGFLFS